MEWLVSDMKNKNWFSTLAIFLAAVLFSIQTPIAKGSFIENPLADQLAGGTLSGGCHFGMAAMTGGANGYDSNLDRYNLSALGVGSYITWTSNPTAGISSDIQFLRVITVGGDDASFALTLTSSTMRISANPGSTWLIGNEPDSQVLYQDHISAETYAARFYALATNIRQADPTARIGFGTIIQPTPLRMYYLSKVITRLTELAGSRANALSLIDIYSIHAFILNEEPLYDSSGHTINWGAGVPVGYDAATWPAITVVDGNIPTQTIDINTFKAGVQRYRQWMKNLGEQGKPLWITEYGSLFPTFLDISDEMSAAYMEQTFDYMLGTKDSALGYAPDDYRLVQKFVWYSLNDRVDHFGGSLYNPETGLMTAVGTHFISYNPGIIHVPITDSDAYIAAPPLVFNGKTFVKIGNHVSSDRLTPIQVSIYKGGNLVGSTLGNLPRCGGNATFLIDLNEYSSCGAGGEYQVNVSLQAGSDTDLSNNTFLVNAANTYCLSLPVIAR